ncbi:MAG: hypothetical protein SF029_24985 [bacterium]|nr:hypothetical protein [bacterium]
MHPITPTQAQDQTRYRWNTVPIGGGGYVTGMVIHPTEPNLIYIRTDVGGAYRLDTSENRWIQIADSLGTLHDNFAGVESIAVDPSDPDIVYIVVGMYRREQLAAWGSWAEGDPEPTGMFKSTNRGETWTQLNVTVSSGANEPWRWIGERLAVDPNDGRVVLFGSRSEGLWRSADAGETWVTVDALPLSTEVGAGVLWVAFDASSGSAGSPTPVIYAGVYGGGVYRSTDTGETWDLVNNGGVAPGQSPQRAAIASDGTLYVSFVGSGTYPPGTWKFQDETWTNITPRAGLNFSAISVDPANPQRLIVAQEEPNWGNRLFYSENGGTDWIVVQANADFTIPWYLPDMFGAAISSLTFDPHVPNRVWFTDWYNTWVTDDISQQPSRWQNVTAGHEETVILTLTTPPAGAPLLSGAADVTGFVHARLDQYAEENIANFALQDITGIDYAEANPDYLVFVGGRRYNNSGDGGYSTNGGRTWTRFATVPPNAIHGKIAVSSDGSSIVWIPTSQQPHYSTDNGQTWQVGTGVPAGSVGILWETEHPLAADRDTPGRFYLLRGDSLVRSDDDGATWETIYRFPVNMESGMRKHPLDTERIPEVSAWAVDPGFRIIHTMPGEVWVQLGNQLFASQDGGETFTTIPQVDALRRFALGVAVPGSSRPTVFIWGMVDEQEGVYRSSDTGETWTRIDTPDVPIFSISHLRGDRQVFGRVYLGLNGRGIWVGEPEDHTD